MAKLISILIAFFLPPLSVFLNKGIGLHFFLNIVLCLLFVLPASIHALYLLLKSKESNEPLVGTE
jgi:uncharacterized membrane protein YqaE (UPF0057 family)